MTELLEAPAHERADRLNPLPLVAAVDEPQSRVPVASVRTWVARHAVSLPIVLGLLVACGLLVGTGIARYPTFGDDEGTYVAEAWAFLTHGQLSHYTYWYDHPPLGWIQLALLTWVLGPLAHGSTAIATARHLMVVPALATTALLYLLGRRLRLRRPFAAMAVLLVIASPLGLSALRQVYLENFALPWVLGAFALCASPSRRLWAFAAGGVCFALGVLTKETMLLFLPGLVVLVVSNADRRTRAFCLSAFLAAFVLVAGAYPLYAALKGELFPGPGHVSLWQAVGWQLFGRHGSGSVFSAGSEANGLVAGWLSVDPWLLGLGVAAIVPALFLRRLRGIAVAVAAAVLVGIHGGYLPEPFDIGLLPFCGLLVAGVLDWIAGRAPLGRHRPGRAAWSRPLGAGALVAVLAVLVTPGWRRGDAYAMNADRNAQTVAAEHWVEAHVPHRARVLIDDTMYVDFVRSGFRPRYGVVWFYKLGFTNNLDPAIVRHLPAGWREFDYVVETPVMRSALAQDPAGYRQVRLALSHSRPVASFGSGADAIEVRRLMGTGVGSGYLPPAKRPGRRRR